MWVQLFYDKYAGDHHFENQLTKDVTIEDLSDGSYDVYLDEEGLKYYNDKFSGNFKLDNFLSDMCRLCIYTKVDKGVEKVYTVVRVDSKKLEQFILDNKQIPHDDFLKSLCRFHLSYTKSSRSEESSFHKSGIKKKIDGNMEYIINKSSEDVNYIVDSKIGNPSEITAELYDYQKCSVNWMVNKEQNDKPVKYCVDEEVVIGNVYYDTRHHNFIHADNRKQISFYGGGLIDEVGLGKTVQMITLSIMNQKKNPYYTVEGVNKLFSRATLVLCPNHLCNQWLREFDTMVSKDFKLVVVPLMTKKHFDKYTYQDVLDADFVVVSYTFFDNKNVTQKWCPRVSTVKSFNKQSWSSSNIKTVDELFNQMRTELLEDPFKILTDTNPLVQLVHWHRVVVDEFHEVHNNSKYKYVKNILPHIDSTYRWCMTATPFADKYSLEHTVDYLTNNKNCDGNDIYMNSDVVNYLSTNCFRRNSKTSVEQEYTLPPTTEEIVWLKFTDVERTMYNAHIANPNNDKFGVYLRQLCCHPQLADETKYSLSNCKSLQDIEKMMVVHYKKNMDKAQDNVDKIVSRIEKVKDKIIKIKSKQKVDDDDMDEELVELLDNITTSQNRLKKLEECVKQLKEKLSEANKVLEGKTTTYNFFTTVIDKLKQTVNKETDDDSCVICMSEIPESNIGVSKCGHIFCYTCLKMSVNMYHNCPMCKNKLADTDIFVLSYSKKSNDVKDKLIDTVGTKLANLIHLLKERDERTIVFSQWDDMLRRVGTVLSENGIKNVFCRGNCYQKDKSVREFNDSDDIKVIMLSSDSAAAGTNLTKASQIVFIDPIYGDKQFRNDQERQAIGRAHRLGQKNSIRIVRLIVKDTVEEEIYLSNIEDDKAD